ncbi:MAG: DUF5312 family protein [Spirochaetia bacterium]
MINVFDAIQDFFFSLFNNDPKELQKRKDMRRVQDDLKSFKPSCYKKSSKELTTDFASMLFTLYQNLRPICDILAKTLNNPDPKIAQRFKDYLIEVRLPEDIQEKRYAFTYDEMNKRVLNSSKTDQEIQALSREFSDFVRIFSEPELKAANTELQEMERLIALCRHDWEKTLAYFDASIKLSNPNFKPKFSPTPGKQVLPEILDLYYILGPFRIDNNVEQNLIYLLQRISASQSPEYAGRLKKLVANIRKILNKRLTPQHILAIIRAISDNPYLTPKTDTEVKDFVAPMKDRLTKEFNNARERINREKSESEIEKDLNSLFGEADLLVVGGYNSELNRVLQAKGLASFSQVKALQILKSYVVAKFEKLLKDPIKKIIIEGFFEDKQKLNIMSNTYYRCEKSKDRLDMFEESITSDNRVSVPAIQKQLKQASKGKDVSSVVDKMVETIDNRAKEIVSEETNMYYALANYISEIINDYKKSTPELVSNIRTIGGNHNREMMNNILKGYNDTIKFLRVMSHFTILKQQKGRLKR